MDGSRLPRPIGTQKAKNLSRFEAQGQRVESGVPAELLRDCRKRQARSHVRKRSLKQKEIRTPFEA
jgi:hypothetical protein